jgi:hypothetical protein
MSKKKELTELTNAQLIAKVKKLQKQLDEAKATYIADLNKNQNSMSKVHQM